MRRLQRTALTNREAAWLEAWTSKITALPPAEHKAKSDKCWADTTKNKATNPLGDIEAKLQVMASGQARCMYCEDNQASSIDHFEPRARTPAKTFCWENLLYACALCNSNTKRDQFPVDPQTGAPLLIDPTKEDPLDHLLLVPATGELLPRHDPQRQAESPKGRATIDTFGLSRRSTLNQGRLNAWASIQALIIQYDDSLSEDDPSYANTLRASLCSYPFSSVFLFLLRVAALNPVPEAARLQPKCLAALARRPEIFTWLCL